MPRNFVSNCTAVCAVTGRRCRLLAHSPETPHRSERGAFHRVAAPGQTTFALRQQLDEAATRASKVGWGDLLNQGTTAHGGTDGVGNLNLANPVRKSTKRRGVSAHLGDVTTVGGNEKARELRRQNHG